jgi:hypothetical protein
MPKSKSKTKTTKQKQKQKQSQTVIVNIDTKVKRRKSTKSKKQSHPEKPVSHPSSSIQFSPVINMPSQYQPIPNNNAIQSQAHAQSAVPIQSPVRQESYHRSHNNIPQSYLQPIQTYSEPDIFSMITDIPSSGSYENDYDSANPSHYTMTSDSERGGIQVHPESFQSGAESIQSNLSQASDVRSSGSQNTYGLQNLFNNPETFQSAHESVQSNLSQASDVRPKSSSKASIHEEPAEESETVYYEPPTQEAEVVNALPVIQGELPPETLLIQLKKATNTLEGRFNQGELRNYWIKYYNNGVEPDKWTGITKPVMIGQLKKKFGNQSTVIAIQAGPSFEDEEIAVRVPTKTDYGFPHNNDENNDIPPFIDDDYDAFDQYQDAIQQPAPKPTSVQQKTQAFLEQQYEELVRNEKQEAGIIPSESVTTEATKKKRKKKKK